MNWFMIALLFALALAVIICTVKQNRISDLETENVLLKEEVESYKMQVTVLRNNIEKIKEAQDAVKALEEQKQKKPQKKESAPGGDVDSRLDRLNGLSDKKS